jgi:hypothetical protein
MGRLFGILCGNKTSPVRDTSGIDLVPGAAFTTILIEIICATDYCHLPVSNRINPAFHQTSYMMRFAVSGEHTDRLVLCVLLQANIPIILLAEYGVH